MMRVASERVLYSSSTGTCVVARIGKPSIDGGFRVGVAVFQSLDAVHERVVVGENVTQTEELRLTYDGFIGVNLPHPEIPHSEHG